MLFAADKNGIGFIKICKNLMTELLDPQLVWGLGFEPRPCAYHALTLSDDPLTDKKGRVYFSSSTFKLPPHNGGLVAIMPIIPETLRFVNTHFYIVIPSLNCSTPALEFLIIKSMSGPCRSIMSCHHAALLTPAFA